MPWIVQWADLVAPDAVVLDLAAGRGRHTFFFAERGNKVLAVDRDTSRLPAHANIEPLIADLEDGSPWPLTGRRFGAAVVTNYLHRPLLPALVESLERGGLLVYETFAAGNERFGKPSNPAFLLRPGELLDAVHGKLRVLAYEDLVVEEPRPAAVQRICARRE